MVKIAGFIKDYRQELESEVWLMPPLYHRVWQWLKYNVNHAEVNVPLRNGSTVLVKPGERITSIRKIAEGVAWYERGILKEPNPRTISEILKWLTKKKMIVVSNGESNSQYTLVSLINWDVYQDKEDKSNGESNAQSNSKTTVRQQSVHINKNDNNEKNDKKINYSEFVRLTVVEYDRLVSEFNQEAVSRMIEILNNYKGSKGKKYASDNLAIRSWVIKRYEEESNQTKLFGNKLPKVSKRDQSLNELERILSDYDRSNVQDNTRPMLRELS